MKIRFKIFYMMLFAIISIIVAMPSAFLGDWGIRSNWAALSIFLLKNMVCELRIDNGKFCKQLGNYKVLRLFG